MAVDIPAHCVARASPTMDTIKGYFSSIMKDYDYLWYLSVGK